MQNKFKCEVSFYVGGALEYTSHDELLQLQSKLIEALLIVLPRVSVSNPEFKDLGLLPIFDRQDADDVQPHDPVEESSLPEVASSWTTEHLQGS